MDQTTRQYLLGLSRKTLEYYFESKGDVYLVDEGELSNPELREKRGTFVTLQKHGDLRGCIGHIEAVQELFKDVIDNTCAAAFEDPRFLPLQEDELQNIKIEISVLTVPQKLLYVSVEDLFSKLRPNTDGVIIEKGRYSATYLPQVWEELPDKKEFLSSLCLKAGLPEHEWEHGMLEVMVYQAEVFGEKVF